MKVKAVMLLSLCLLLTAGCSGQTKQEESAVSSAVPAASAETSEETASSVPELLEVSQEVSRYEFQLDDKRPYDTVDEYLTSDAAKEMIKRLSSTDEPGVLTTKVYSKERTCLVLERQLGEDFNLWLVDSFLEKAQALVESKRQVFVALIDDLESCINTKILTVVVRYTDPEGNVLFEKQFDNDTWLEASAEETSKSPETSRAETSKAPETSRTETSKPPETSRTETSKTPEASRTHS